MSKKSNQNNIENNWVHYKAPSNESSIKENQPKKRSSHEVRFSRVTRSKDKQTSPNAKRKISSSQKAKKNQKKLNKSLDEVNGSEEEGFKSNLETEGESKHQEEKTTQKKVPKKKGGKVSPKNRFTLHDLTMNQIDEKVKFFFIN